MHDYIELTQAAKLMRGRGGRAPSIETLRRWANHKRGCRPLGELGPTIFLRVARVNGYLVTTAEWVQEFERQRLALGTREIPLPTPSRTQRASVRRANEILDRAGIGATGA